MNKPLSSLVSAALNMNDYQRQKSLDLLKLRLAVGALGETRGWWRTHACTPSYKLVLQQLFPHSWRLASMNATAEGAKLMHQKAVTNRSQHLFRFHTELEQDLRRLMSEAGMDGVFDAVVGDPFTVLQELAEKGVRLHEGAVSLGLPTRENIYRMIPRMAAYYMAAFNGEGRCWPYFDPEVA